MHVAKTAQTMVCVYEYERTCFRADRKAVQSFGRMRCLGSAWNKDLPLSFA